MLSQLIGEMDSFKRKISDRLDQQFFGQMTSNLLNQLPQEISSGLILDFSVSVFILISSLIIIIKN